jgi:hypothetical protein
MAFRSENSLPEATYFSEPQIRYAVDEYELASGL